MRFYQRLTIALLIFAIAASVPVSAKELTAGLSTEAISDEDQRIAQFPITLVTEAPHRAGITCFAVSEDGRIALGWSAMGSHEVAVYNKDFTWQWGIRFSSPGSFGLELAPDGLLIYLVREQLAVLADQSGKIRGIRQIAASVENDRYWREHINAIIKENSDGQYRLCNDMGILNWTATSYSQLVRTDANGNQQVLYDATTAQLLATLFALAVFLGLFCFVGSKILPLIKAGRSDKQKNPNNGDELK